MKSWHLFFLQQLTIKRFFRSNVLTGLFKSDSDSSHLEPVYWNLFREFDFDDKSLPNSFWSICLESVDKQLQFKFNFKSLPTLYHIPTSTVFIQTNLPQWLIELNFVFEVIDLNLIGSLVQIYLSPRLECSSTFVSWLSTQCSFRIDKKLSIFEMVSVTSQNILSYIFNKTNFIYLSLCVLIDNKLFYNIHLSSPIFVCFDNFTPGLYDLPTINNTSNFLTKDKCNSKSVLILSLLFEFHQSFTINEDCPVDEVLVYLKTKLCSDYLYDVCGMFGLDGIFMITHEVFGAICIRIWKPIKKHFKTIEVWTW